MHTKKNDKIRYEDDDSTSFTINLIASDSFEISSCKTLARLKNFA